MKTVWLDSGTNTTVPSDGGVFGGKANPVAISVDAGTGTVVVQQQDSTGAWVAMADGTFSADGTYQVYVSNMNAIRVVATGDAEYQVNWDGER